MSLTSTTIIEPALPLHATGLTASFACESVPRILRRARKRSGGQRKLCCPGARADGLGYRGHLINRRWTVPWTLPQKSRTGNRFDAPCIGLAVAKRFFRGGGCGRLLDIEGRRLWRGRGRLPLRPLRWG